MRNINEIKEFYKKFTTAMSDWNIERRKFRNDIRAFLDSEAKKFFSHKQVAIPEEIFIVDFDGGCMTFNWEADVYVSSINTGTEKDWKSYQARKDGSWIVTTFDEDCIFKQDMTHDGPCLVKELEDFCKHLSETLGIKVSIHYHDRELISEKEQEDEEMCF